MTTRRTMVWFILFILTVPTVVVAADALQRATAGDGIITAGHLHEGEKAVYDLTYRSLLHGVNTTVKGQFRIEVGEVTSQDFGNAPAIDVLPIHYVSKTPPWVAAAGEVDETEGTLSVRITDGHTMQHVVHRHRVTFEEDEDGTVDRSEETSTSTLRPSHQWDRVQDRILQGTVEPGDTFAQGTFVVQAALSILGHGSVLDHGVLNGHDVYQVGKDQWHAHFDSSFACFVDQPHLVYRDPEGRQAQVENLTNHQTSAIWIRPGVAFPAYSWCRSVYSDGGQVVEDLSLEFTLTDHKSGGAAVPMPFDPVPLQVPRPLPVTPVLVPGLPAQGDAETFFPVDDLLSVLLEAEELEGFRDLTPTPFVVARFTYYEQVLPRHAPTVAPSGPLPDPTGLLGQAPVPREPAFEATWEVDLINGENKTVSFEVVRTFDSLGAITNESVKASDPRTARDPTDRAYYPKQMLSLSTLLDAWSRHTTSDGVWHEATVRSISLAHNTRIDHGSTQEYLFAYDLRHGAHAEPSTYTWREQRGSFEATTGRLTSHDSVAHDREADHPGPQPSLQDVAAATVISPAGYDATWAASSGLAVTLAFLVVYFWEGIMRFAVIPMYAKVSKDKVLDHATRERFVTYVSANPGATLGAVRRELGAGHGTVMHHANTLVRNGILVTKKVGRQRCFFQAGARSVPEMQAAAAAAPEAAHRLLEALRAEPGLTQQELAERLDVTSPAIRYQTKRLLGHDAIRMERDGRRVRYYAGPMVEA